MERVHFFNIKKVVLTNAFIVLDDLCFHNRSPDAHEHDYLLAFLKRCKHIYDMDGRYMPLLIDLMQLRIPNLLVGGRSEEDLCVRSEFIEFINQHINFSPTKDLLKKKIKVSE